MNKFDVIRVVYKVCIQSSDPLSRRDIKEVIVLLQF